MSSKQINGAVSLVRARAGQWACVSVVDGSHGSAHRLAHLGLMTGHLVRMVRPSRNGPVVVEVKGSRLALGQGLARKILVRLVEIDPSASLEGLAVPAE
jgi:Fe2+ transport system protein FeoA